VLPNPSKLLLLSGNVSTSVNSAHTIFSNIIWAIFIPGLTVKSLPNVIILSERLYHETPLVKTKSLKLQQLPENTELIVRSFWFVTFRKKQYPVFIFMDSYQHYIGNETFTERYNKYEIIPKELIIKYTFVYKRKNKKLDIDIVKLC